MVVRLLLERQNEWLFSSIREERRDGERGGGWLVKVCRDRGGGWLMHYRTAGRDILAKRGMLRTMATGVLLVRYDLEA